MSSGFSKLYRSGYPLSLERSLISQIIAYKKTAPLGKLWVLVPNHYVGSHLRHKIAVENAHINISFVTFADFSKKLLSEHKQFLNRKKLPSTMELLKISEICKKQLKGTLFEESSDKVGFHKNLQNFFHHLISEEIDHIPNINPKTKAFEEIYAYYRGLRNRYYHDLWSVELASKTVLKIKEPVFVYGFAHFTKLEKSLLQQIADSTSLRAWIEVFSIENFQIPTLNWLDNHFKDVEDLEEQVEISKTGAQFCSHIQDESLWITKNIIDRQKTNPKPFNQFGVFLNDYQNQRPFIEKSFQKFGIPYVSLNSNRLSETRLGQSLIILINLLLTNWSRNQWFDFLQTFPFEPFFFEENGTPTDWNSFSVDAGISNKNSFFLERFEILATKNVHEKIRPFVEFQKKLLHEISVIESFVERADFKKLPQQLNTFIQKYADQSSITTEFLKYFDDLDYIFSDVKPTWEEIRNTMNDQLMSSMMSSKVFESDGVLIAPFSVVQGLFFDVIFCPQMNEGYFPKNNTPTFDLHADEMRQLSEKTRISFDQIQKQFDIQVALLDSLKYRAKNNVYLSYSAYALPKEDDLKPSISILSWAKNSQLFDASKFQLSRDIQKETVQKIRSWVSSEQSLQWTNFNSKLDSKGKNKEVYSVTELSRYAECPKRYFLANILGLTSEEYLEEHIHIMPKDKGTLIHEILFRFFMKLKEQNLIPLKKEKREQMLNLLSLTAQETFKKYQTITAYGIPDLWKLDEKELLSDLTAYLDQEILDASYWIPYAFEYRFGMKKMGDQEDDPHSIEKPIALPVNQNHFLFKGRVDRIDVSADQKNMRIIDYKTGKLFERKAWSYENGTKLQLPIYLLLSDQFLTQKPEHVEGKLVSLQAISKFDERKVTKEEILDQQQPLYQHLSLLDQGIREGIFFPNPEKGENCKFCDFLGFCGKNMHQTVENIEPTEFMQRYHELKKVLS